MLAVSENRLPSWLGNDGDRGAFHICCPVCGCDSSHIQEVFTSFGVDPSEGGTPYPGTVAKGTVQERRDALVIKFDGECGHKFDIVIQQCKGGNFVSATPVVE